MRIDLLDSILVYELEIETEGVHRKTFWNTIIETKYGVFDMPCPQPKVDDELTFIHLETRTWNSANYQILKKSREGVC